MCSSPPAAPAGGKAYVSNGGARYHDFSDWRMAPRFAGRSKQTIRRYGPDPSACPSFAPASAADCPGVELTREGDVGGGAGEAAGYRLRVAAAFAAVDDVHVRMRFSAPVDTMQIEVTSSLIILLPATRTVGHILKDKKSSITI